MFCGIKKKDLGMIMIQQRVFFFNKKKKKKIETRVFPYKLVKKSIDCMEKGSSLTAMGKIVQTGPCSCVSSEK